MAADDACLSVPFIAATTLVKGTISVEDFRSEALTDPATLALGRRVKGISDGHPTKPMTRNAHLAKFRRNWAAGAVLLPPGNGERLIALINDSEHVEDVRALVDLMVV